MKTRKNHKYILRLKLGDAYRYFYSQDEIDAYYNKGKQKVNDLTRKASQAAQKLNNWAKKASDKANKSYTRYSKDISNNVKNAYSKAANYTRRAINRIEKKSISQVKSYSKKAKALVDDIVSKAASTSKKVSAKNILGTPIGKRPKLSDRVKNMVDSAIKKYKYIKKELTEAGMRYFYSMKEWAAYNSRDERAKRREERKREKEQEKREKEQEKREKKERELRDKYQNDSEEVKKIPLKDDLDATKEEDMKEINPNYDDDEGYQVNCMYCTTAYEMRRRGYDVEANPRTDGGGSIEDMFRWYKPPEEVRNNTIAVQDNNFTRAEISKAIEYEMKKAGDGARGNFMVYWDGGGGHSMAYEVENNKVVIYDNQVNEKYEIEDVLQYVDYNTGGNVFWTRTDNLELSDYAMETVKPKK